MPIVNPKSSIVNRTADSARSFYNLGYEELAKVGIEWAVANTADGSLAASGNLVFAGGNGKLAAYRADSGDEVWKADVTPFRLIKEKEGVIH